MDINKLVQRSEVYELVQNYKKQGKTIVFTNGCFDIVHAGHVKYLSQTASLADILVLGLNSDLSVKSIKGDKRPVINQEHRACVISAFEFIDHVVLFDEPDPGELIREICPDVLVKGADWPEEKIIGADFVKSLGGKVARIELEPDISTSKIIEKIGRLFYGR